MAFSVRDLMELEIFRNFKLIAGKNGLDKPIESVEILDFEFVKGAKMNRESILDGRSITISSLLFAKDEPEKIVDAVKKMYELNVSCFAFKPAIIKEIPQEAIDFANENDFAIFKFVDDVFFEDIVMAVRSEIGVGENIDEIEKKLEMIVDEAFPEKDVYKFVRQLNPSMKRYIRVVGVRDDQRTEKDIKALSKKLASVDKISQKACLCKFREGYLIILSQPEEDDDRFDALLSDVFVTLDVDKSGIKCGFSSIKKRDSEFRRCVIEGFWSTIVSIIEGRAQSYYENIGIYRFIIPEINSAHIDSYMHEYLGPLLELKDGFLETAINYILCRGDIIDTAEKMFCHKNTVRYRMSKIQEMLDPNSNDKEFYENLSLAIRVYLLEQYR